MSYIPTSLEYDLTNEILSEVCEVKGCTPKFEELPPSEVKMPPLSVQPPTFELKPLSSTLKYIFLGKPETFPVVISSCLNKA